MSKEQKKYMLVIAAILILLYLLFKSKATPASTALRTSTTSYLVSSTGVRTPVGVPSSPAAQMADPRTGIPYGTAGVGISSHSVGLAAIPPDRSFGPYVDDNDFISWYNNGGSAGIPLCPQGTGPQVDPNDLGVYCVYGAPAG
jgi:hypothetical protein